MEKRHANQKKVVWAITGSGDRIESILDVMKEVQKTYGKADIRVFISKAGEQVLKWYSLFESLKSIFKHVRVEINPNAPFLAGEVQTGIYEFMLIAPSTSNTTAKISLGIGDSLVSNAASMAIKAALPVYLLPSDYEVGFVTTKLPSGRELRLKILEKDVKHVHYLEDMDSIYILRSPQEIPDIFEKYFQD